MPVYKNKDNGTWYVMTQYTDWKGERKPKCKRGFATKREAQDWEQKFQAARHKSWHLQEHFIKTALVLFLTSLLPLLTLLLRMKFTADSIRLFRVKLRFTFHTDFQAAFFALA